MTAAEALDRGRDSFARRAWADAFVQLSAADQDSPLEATDLERVATAAYLIGKDAASAAAWERAHHECLRIGDAARAARCAFWLAVQLLNRGETARAGGWLARAQRLIDEGMIHGLDRDAEHIADVIASRGPKGEPAAVAHTGIGAV